ncbi:TetR/AcrR family transcriptional regulator [Bacillus kexueae]|uniref:TetR/AcrR family transcriptional regulator n=1 Tax=Aeribacillus kexueae TaxID=2078952 RepID=UPI001FAF7B36|nr:TetR family transcriptional regulator [Bacillus kexueae]
MSFVRARNDENKKVRLEQIKEAALKLFDEMPYHEITLSKVGKEINFTRANLYKYISTKEDIYILIIMDEINRVIDDMESSLVQADPLDTYTLAHQWANILNNHPRYLKLFSLLFTMLEQNTTLETLIEFKNYLAVVNGRILKILKHNLPEFDDQDLAKLMDMAFSYIIARYPLCNPSPVQIEATKLSAYNYEFPNFVESFSEALVYLINGMKLEKIK